MPVPWDRENLRYVLNFRHYYEYKPCKMNPMNPVNRMIGTGILVLSFCACSQGNPDSIPEVEEDTAAIETTNERRIPDPDYTLKNLVIQNRYSKDNLRILIDKSECSLNVFHKDSLLITYPCVFGFNPVDDKHQEGDGCTPEGAFKIRSMYAHSSWSYFIWIDYPNQESRRRFKARQADGTIESSATIGGEIGIHGVPEGADELVDDRIHWTLGCISLKTAHIKDLYKSIGTTTLVEIVP